MKKILNPPSLRGFMLLTTRDTYAIDADGEPRVFIGPQAAARFANELYEHGVTTIVCPVRIVPDLPKRKKRKVSK